MITTTAFVGTYPPYPCGVAAYVYDLATAAFPRQIVAIIPDGDASTYPAEVQHRIRQGDPADYRRVAEALDRSTVSVASLHFDPDLWGGADGDTILVLLDALSVPAVTTLHALPPNPTAHQRTVVRGIVDGSAATVVLSRAAATRLIRVYGVARDQIDVISHGIPNLPLVEPDTVKPRLDVAGRPVLLSFGLLRPSKGLERMIAAMPRILEAQPSALYAIVGPTDAAVQARDGDGYRQSLVAMVEAAGLGASVRFEDRFLGRVELARWVEAADVVIAPSIDGDQISSGSLAYALGAGRAVVTTPSAFTRERVTSGRGMLVDPDPDAIADAVLRLLADDKLRASLGRRAYESSRPDVWSAAGAAYGQIFSRIAREPASPASHPVRSGRLIAR